MARAIGINHVAIEVGDIDAALEFYGALFELRLRGRSGQMAFVDLGDQFIALSRGRSQAPDDVRHFGLVVDDVAAVRATLERLGATIRPGSGLDFVDPWGNYVQVVGYGDVQFMKTPGVLSAMDAGDLGKSAKAVEELRTKGIDPP